MSERKLAYIVTIDDLQPIEGADRIETAIIGGWQVIVQKGLYGVGSKAVYFEIDSLLNTEMPAFASLATLSSKLLHNIDGVTHARIKTMKMKGVVSQGFCAPLSACGVGLSVPEGTDLTGFLGVKKYESAEENEAKNGTPGIKTGKSALGFPKFIPKTDQTRVQNVTALVKKAHEEGETFEKSFKLDGSSLTAYVHNGFGGVCSRNVGFRMQDQGKGFVQTVRDFLTQWKERGFKNAHWEPMLKADDNTFTQMAASAGLCEAIHRDGRNLAIQGEMVGPSIQKNFEGVDKNMFFCYDIYIIDEQRYMLPHERQEFCKVHGILHVPIAEVSCTLPYDVQAILDDADGPSGLNGKYREGFVYKSNSRDFSFKAISNKYLLKEA